MTLKWRWEWLSFLLFLHLLSLNLFISAQSDQPMTVDLHGAPHFMIIGAAKCGTSSLARYLSGHPSVCLSHAKELHFFDNLDFYKKGREFYKMLLESGESIKPNCTHYMDATPAYIRNPDVPARMATLFTQSELKQKRFILILREPVARECSWFNHISGFCIREVAEKLNANVSDPVQLCTDKPSNSKIPHCGQMDCLDRIQHVTLSNLTSIVYTMDEYIASPHFEPQGGYYDEQIANWLKVVDRQQIFIVNLESLVHNSSEVIHSMLLFLGLTTLDSKELFPHQNRHARSACTCKGLQRLHHLHKDRGTNRRTYDVIRSNAKSTFEPDFFEFDISAAKVRCER